MFAARPGCVEKDCCCKCACDRLAVPATRNSNAPRFLLHGRWGRKYTKSLALRKRLNGARVADGPSGLIGGPTRGRFNFFL